MTFDGKNIFKPKYNDRGEITGAWPFMGFTVYIEEIEMLADAAGYKLVKKEAENDG